MTNHAEEAAFRLANELFNARDGDNWADLIATEIRNAGAEDGESSPAYAFMVLTLYYLLAGVNVVSGDAAYPFDRVAE